MVEVSLRRPRNVDRSAYVMDDLYLRRKQHHIESIFGRCKSHAKMTLLGLQA